MLANVRRLSDRRKAHASHLTAERPMPLIVRGNPEAKPESRTTVGSREAGLTLDGGENGGNSGLSADAVAF